MLPALDYTNTDAVVKQYYVGLQALAMAILLPYMSTATQFFPVFDNQWRYVSHAWWVIYPINTVALTSCPPMYNQVCNIPNNISSYEYRHIAVGRVDDSLPHGVSNDLPHGFSYPCRQYVLSRIVRRFDPLDPVTH